MTHSISVCILPGVVACWGHAQSYLHKGKVYSWRLLCLFVARTPGSLRATANNSECWLTFDGVERTPSLQTPASAWIPLCYHITMIYLFTFKLRWLPGFIKGTEDKAKAKAYKKAK
eukprot:TRINITY_DN38985_c0_g1_i1.p1 TRINITY_DN38985_c0_g1~~TRINITY_DN38985_c0_g1_i1.p1  ORF type:complete len:116 (-),score=17.72 TRINITY_DN38985_c0_g1_i1:119-466(-)